MYAEMHIGLRMKCRPILLQQLHTMNFHKNLICSCQLLDVAGQTDMVKLVGMLFQLGAHASK
jgi:hypothetical protein